MFVFGLLAKDAEKFDKGEPVSIKVNGKQTVVRRSGDRVRYNGSDTVFKIGEQQPMSGTVQYFCVPHDAKGHKNRFGLWYE